jgi:hypothetical protein
MPSRLATGRATKAENRFGLAIMTTLENNAPASSRLAGQAESMASLAGAEAPARSVRREGLGRLASTVLEGREWKTPRLVLRSTHIAGPAAEIFNVMGFPEEPDKAPIYAAELIFFGKAPRVAAVDLQPVWGASPEAPPLDAKLDACLAPLAERFADLPRSDGMPGWCAAYFTARAVYSRPDDPGSTPRLVEACGAFFQAFLNDWIAADAAPPPPEAAPGSRARCRAALAEYKRHHREHLPGQPYLGKVFGEDWTRDFLESFMYS